MDERAGRRVALLDGSRLITESCARAGADVFVGYPITPASLIYGYASRRFPSILAAPDEITALQWMAGLSAVGRLPVTATSFPGLALMVESLNMAYMMELPMLVVMVQRLGPSTGTATAGAQDDVRFLHGILSGGYPLPVYSIADLDDCWNLPPVALQTAVDLRTPVVLLTSKEMVMTERSISLERLGRVGAVKRSRYEGDAPYRPYAAPGASAPAFLPLGSKEHQVRLTASTHGQDGTLSHSSQEALGNTRRLPAKIEAGTTALFDLQEGEDAQALIVTYGITSGAAKEAVRLLAQQGVSVSLLVARTLVPVPAAYVKIINRYRSQGVRVVFAEENLQGQFASLLFGERLPEGVCAVGDIGRMISPDQIIEGIGT